MYDLKEYEEIVKNRLSPERFEHSVNVAKRAVELAKINGVNEEKAYLTGILHDITKETSYSEQEKYLDTTPTALEKSNKMVYHQMSGEGYVRKELGIDDEEILSAIRYHTTGHSNMTVFEMVIYLADLTSAERNYPDIEIVRQTADNSLYEGMLVACQFTICDLAGKKRIIHPNTLDCYNWVLDILNKKERD